MIQRGLKICKHIGSLAQARMEEGRIILELRTWWWCIFLGQGAGTVLMKDPEAPCRKKVMPKLPFSFSFDTSHRKKKIRQPKQNNYFLMHKCYAILFPHEFWGVGWSIADLWSLFGGLGGSLQSAGHLALCSLPQTLAFPHQSTLIYWLPIGVSQGKILELPYL